MATPLQQLEFDQRLKQLELDLADVTRRLRALEDGQRAAGHTAEYADTAPPEPPDTVFLPARPAESTRGTSDLTGLASLLGRTCIVFGGAYLLRALTESGRLPATAGVLIGLTYSFTWLIAAYRSSAQRVASAQFHGVTAMLVGLPIVWEAASHFGILSPATAAALLAAGSGAAFVVAGLRSLDAVAAVAAFGTMATALATAWSTNNYGVFAVLLVGLSTATYWLSERPGHAWLRWPNAIAAGLAVVAVTARALTVPPRESIAVALLAQALLVATMQGSLAVRIVMFGRNARLFDIMQALSGLVIGVGGAALLGRSSPAALTLIGAVTAILASGAYLGAFFRLADRPHLAASYHAFAAFGLLAATMAQTLLFRDHVLALASLTLAIGTIALGQRRLGGYASLHGAAYVLIALYASDLLAMAVSVWTLRPSPWPTLDLVAWISLAAAGACVTMKFTRRNEIGDLLTQAGRLITAAAFVLGLGAAVLTLIGPAIAGAEPDAGILASLRTVLLSIAVVVLALTARWPATRIFSRLVYPVLVVGGVRLLLDDFRNSSPSTLFIALGCYGLGLLLAPRLMKSDAAR